MLSHAKPLRQRARWRLAAVSAAAAAALGTAAAAHGSQASRASAAGHKTVAYILGVAGSPFYEAMACGAKAEAAKLGVSLKVSAPTQFAPAQQAPVLDAAIATHPQALVIVPTDVSALDSGIKQAESAGIKVLTADESISRPQGLTSQILSNNVAGGAQVADQLAKELHGHGKVLLLTTAPGESSGQDERAQGFIKELKKYPGITYVGAQYSNDEPAQTASEVTAELSRYPDLAGIFADNDQSGIGAASALKSAHKGGTVKLWEYDAAVSEVQALRSGTVQGLIAQQPRLEGMDAVLGAVHASEGKKQPFVVKTSTKVLTRSTPTKTLRQYQYQGSCGLGT